jgi:hypothetical protein
VWDPEEKEAAHFYSLNEVGKETVPEVEEMHGMEEFTNLQPGDHVIYHYPENTERPAIEFKILGKEGRRNNQDRAQNVKYFDAQDVETKRIVILRPFDRSFLEIPKPPEVETMHGVLGYDEATPFLEVGRLMLEARKTGI